VVMELANVLRVEDEPRCKAKHEEVVRVQLEKEEVEKKISARLRNIPARLSLDDKARAYLEKRNVEDAIVPPDKTLEELYERRRVLDHALQITIREFEDVRNAYSRDVCKGLEPANRAHAQAIANALVLLVTAAAAERKFRGAVEDKGIRINLAPAAFPYLGFDLENPNEGFAARWLKDARKAGLIR